MFRGRRIRALIALPPLAAAAALAVAFLSSSGPPGTLRSAMMLDGTISASAAHLDVGTPLLGAGQVTVARLRAGHARTRERAAAAERRADRRAKRQAIELAQQQAAPQSQATAVTDGTVGTLDMPAFESCVISAESGGDPAAYNASSGAGGLFGFLPSTWASLGYAASYPGGAQTAPSGVQQAAFAELYAEAGTAPWAPYDGC